MLLDTAGYAKTPLLYLRSLQRRMDARRGLPFWRRRFRYDARSRTPGYYRTWSRSETRLAYELTRQGRKQLAAETLAWRKLATAVGQVLDMV